jgi:hypothetical protein
MPPFVVIFFLSARDIEVYTRVGFVNRPVHFLGTRILVPVGQKDREGGNDLKHRQGSALVREGALRINLNGVFPLTTFTAVSLVLYSLSER